MSSSQLTNSIIFQRGRYSNHQPVSIMIPKEILKGHQLCFFQEPVSPPASIPYPTINISYGYGSIPIDTFPFTSYFDVHQGYKVLTHCHINSNPESWLNLGSTHFGLIHMKEFLILGRCDWQWLEGPVAPKLG